MQAKYKSDGKYFNEFFGIFCLILLVGICFDLLLEDQKLNE